MKREKKKERLSGIIKKFIGVFLITLGIAGLVLPILPGILLILIGLAFYHNRGIKEYIQEKVNNFKKRVKKRKIFK